MVFINYEVVIGYGDLGGIHNAMTYIKMLTGN